MGSNAAGVTFNVEGNRSYDLVGGKDYSGTDGYNIGKGDVINSYNILKNPAEYTINFILQAQVVVLLSLIHKQKHQH